MSAADSPRIVVPGSTDLGNRVQLRRRERGYRFAKDFAAAMGWSPSMVSRLESGDRGLTDRDVEQLCRYLQVGREWLTPGGGEPDPALTSFAGLVDRLAAARREEVAVLEQLADLLRARTAA